MAQNLGNPFEEPGNRLGDQFEHKVCEYLRQNLPDDYFYRHGVVVSIPVPGQFNKRVPREIDIAVAGPNGLFLIDTKCGMDQIEGELYGNWTYIRTGEEGQVVSKDIRPDRPGEVMRRRLTQVKTLVAKCAPAYKAYQYACAIFVFPEDVRIKIIEGETGKPPAENSPFRLVRLGDELIQSITHWRSVRPGIPPLKARQAKELLNMFAPGGIVASDVVHGFKIVHRGARQTAANGLQYTINELVSLQIGKRRRGKWYDVSAIGSSNRRQFEAQVKRHAEVLAALEHEKHIHRYIDFFPDYDTRGYWVIEEWIDGDTLEVILQRGEQTTLDLRQIMYGIALGLKALHTKTPQKPVFIHRGLNPGAVIVERNTQRAILTNFELARSEGLPTVVVDKFLPDPYCAPELDDPHSADIATDIYSWGAILFI